MLVDRCALCEGGWVNKAWERQHMPVSLAEGVARIIVVVTVPVWSCNGCGESYTDFEADDIRDAVVKALRLAFEMGKNLSKP